MVGKVKAGQGSVVYAMLCWTRVEWVRVGYRLQTTEDGLREW